MRSAISIILVSAILLLFSALAAAQSRGSDFPDYAAGSQALTATPGTQGGAAAGFWNPAAWGTMKEWEFAFQWNDRNVHDKRMDNWGIYAGGSPFGFAMRRNDFNNPRARVDDYQLAVSSGDGEDFWGLAYYWSRGDKDSVPRDHSLALGNIYRPFSFLSIGNSAQIGLNRGDYRFISDVGLRPLRNHRLTLFGDAAYGRYDNPATMQWGAGVEVQPLDGIRIAGKISKPFADSQDKIYSISLGLTLDNLGFHVIPHYDKDSERASTSYLVRVGGQAPCFDARPLFDEKNKVVRIPLKGELTYQRALWFDRFRVPLRETVETIEKSKNDPTVGGILLNLSGAYSNLALTWEVREKLKDFQSAGKKVYVYTDRCGMSEYHLASIADYIILDPMGSLFLPGYMMGRTYWKGFLEKVGIGVEEWRYFTYKSAFESFTRRNMSEADREQRLALIEDFFHTWQNDVTASRKLTPEALRAVIDSMVIVQPEEALAAGLVDTVANWDDAKDIIKELTGDKPDFISPNEVDDVLFADQTWGFIPTIALVYAVGECDMDSGIRGRATSRLLRSLSKRRDVKAVVLRADSPGGDALPSDLVARQMTEVSSKKPMIVSQGQLAASGGYWISMNGDRIFTSPMTITGSIGVIGGWAWNEKLSEKTGFTSDHVKTGEHAEIGFGIILPYFNVMVPDRNLNEYEKARIEKLFRGMYSDFTHKVADARLLTQSYVDSVGQGRVWTGTKAKELGLVDEIGGLEKAIDYARTAAKLKKGRFIIEEYPHRPLIFFEDLFRSSAGEAVARLFFGKRELEKEQRPDYELSVLRRISTNPGTPLPMLSPEDMPHEDTPFAK